MSLSRLRRLIELEREYEEDAYARLAGIDVAGYRLIVRKRGKRAYLYARKGTNELYVGRVTKLVDIEKIIKEKKGGNNC